jgi:hypothetical protein
MNSFTLITLLYVGVHCRNDTVKTCWLCQLIARKQPNESPCVRLDYIIRQSLKRGVY